MLKYQAMFALSLVLMACAPTTARVPSPAVPVPLATPTPSTPLLTPTARLAVVTEAPALTPTPEIKPTMTSNPKLNAQLIAAAEHGDTEMLRNLLAQGADINAQDGRGRTAIMAATHKNKVDVVRLLIESGADINLRDNRSDNPFLYAGAEGLLDILNVLIPAKPDTRLTNRFGGTALIPACERGHVEVVETLLTQTDVDVNHVNNLGWTGLLEAIILSDGGPRHQRIVQLLLQHGADTNIADKDGITPLQHARRRGFGEIVKLLEAQQKGAP